MVYIQFSNTQLKDMFELYQPLTLVRNPNFKAKQMADYFANDPTPGGGTDGSDYFSSDPTPGSSLIEVAPELTTDQGTSLIPIEGGEFTDLLTDAGAKFGFTQMPLLSQAKGLALEGDDSLASEADSLYNKTLELYSKEKAICYRIK